MAQKDSVNETQKDIEDGSSVETEKEPTLLYGVDTMPPFSVAFILALQHVIGSFGGCLMISLTLSDMICADINDPIRYKLFCSSVFMIGVTTTVQNIIGIRLPVLQGVSGAFIAPLLSMKTSGTWTCKDSQTALNITYGNDANTTYDALSESAEYDQETVYNRVREGSLMLAALLEILLGATGLVGRLLQFIGPIPVSVTLMSLGLMLYPFVLDYCSIYFPVSIGGILLLILFILYIPHVTIPIPSTTPCKKKFKAKAESYRLPIFQVFPILLTFLLISAVCGVLTGTGVFPDDKSHSTYRARTDSRLPLINLTPWFYVPHPGQFGVPRFNLAAFIGFLTSYVASSVESVGDYIATSRATDHYPPPRHAINRGILVEGTMGIFAGALGVGHATTTITENIVIIKLTGIASRGVLVVAGCLAMALGVIGKIGAIMTSIPDPAVGGVLFVMLGMLVAVGLSMLNNVNMKSSRNLAVIGISIYTGLVLSEWIKSNPQSLDTGIGEVDDVLKIVLGTPMFTSGITAIVLDNTVRGSKSDRGLSDLQPGAVTIGAHSRRIYNVPMVTRWQTHCRWLRHVPFLQPYSDQD